VISRCTARERGAASALEKCRNFRPRTQSWVEIQETKSPVGTTGNYPKAIPEHFVLSAKSH
jgi:hypothetical protein